MMKRKKASTSSTNRNDIPFHRDFIEPTRAQRKKALGTFPCPSVASNSRRSMLAKSAAREQPSLQTLATLETTTTEEKGTTTTESEDATLDCTTISSSSSSATTATMALSDIDEERLYVPTPRSETSFATPQPRDALDWLAQVPEEGQTFDDYLTLLTTRTSGRIKPLANAGGLDILLLPIVRCPDDGTASGAAGNSRRWPEHAPCLERLAEYAKVFFDRQVRVLPVAELQVSGKDERFTGGTGRNTKKKRGMVSSRPGAFASASKCRFKLSLPGNDGKLHPSVDIAGRTDVASDRIQLQVISLLDELSRYRYNRHNTTTDGEREYCVMGVTMEDLFDGPSDLFCAGMAFGGDKVAVFSFRRYHPRIKMHPLHWHDYGYAETSDGYSYYEDDDQDPEGLSPHPPPQSIHYGTVGGPSDIDNDDTEYLRRSGKLLTHELGHLYGVDHCVHNRCLMMGTGHLVEDFRAPAHLCGVCLRKLQWRLGFSVRIRYGLLSNIFGEMGMKKEKKWTEKQCEYLKDLRSS